MAFEAVVSAAGLSDDPSFNARASVAPHANVAPGGAELLHEADCLRVARAILDSQRRILALLPVSRGLGAVRISEQLGRAAADISRTNIALLSLSKSSRSGIRVSASELGFEVEGRWLSPSLALVAPTHDPEPGQRLPLLQALIAYAAPRVSLVIADLSPLVETDVRQGFAACHLFDGVSLLVRAGVTREREILRAQRELTPQQDLGVLLIA